MRKYIQDILSLRATSDFAKTKSTINEGISLRGYNLWILVCSTILASIGLDTNSTAVIIGAMLISPLMSPILGVGLSVAIHDKQVLTLSLRNLFIAVAISLSASVIYFFLSPLGEPTPELQARTFPTLLDVLIALFGGVAGIVSISRHEQTTAIPGVAIATALMPPLCTAGFGIATANWNYFFGAFYLFFINAVFISLATYLIARYLHFPEKEFVNTKVARQYRIWFIILSMVALTPSTYFLYTVYEKEVIKKEIEELVLSPIKKQGNEILKWEVLNKDTTKLIKVYHSGMQLTDSLKNSIDSSLRKRKMKTYHLVSMRVNLTKEEVSELSAEMTKQMFQEMHLEEIRQLDTINRKPSDNISYTQILKEVKIAFPFVDTMSSGWIKLSNPNNSIDTMPIIFYKTNKLTSKSQYIQLYNFLRARLARDTIVLIKK
ncbi:MAG: TIGR00341 family protein [Ferruginibacter sp.]